MPWGSKRKASESVESKITALEKKAKMAEEQAQKFRSEILELEKRKKVENFVETLSSISCMICNEDIVDCIESDDMSISSYKCKCSIRRIIHSKCWEKEFRCACGEIKQPPNSKNVACSVATLRDIFSVSKRVSTYLMCFSINCENISRCADLLSEELEMEELKKVIKEIQHYKNLVIEHMNSILENSDEVVKATEEAIMVLDGWS